MEDPYLWSMSTTERQFSALVAEAIPLRHYPDPATLNASECVTAESIAENVIEQYKYYVASVSHLGPKHRRLYLSYIDEGWWRFYVVPKISVMQFTDAPLY